MDWKIILLQNLDFLDFDLKQLIMGRDGSPVAIVYDPDSSGDYEATWNSQLNGWTVDFD